MTTSTLPQAAVNSTYNALVTATGGVAPYAWNVSSGNLPAGLTLSRTGAISGTPTAAGPSSFTVSVADSQQPPSVANGILTITVNPALQVTTTSLSDTSPNLFYSDGLTAAGGIPAYFWTITQGSLPAGLTVNTTTGVISGLATAIGTSTFTVQVADNGSPAAIASAPLSITVQQPPNRNAALYTSTIGLGSPEALGMQINSDGSLTPLASSPETAINGQYLAASPTLPLLFTYGGPYNYIQSLIIKPDYSIALFTNASLPLFTNVPLPNEFPNRPSIDPSGSNLYLPIRIDTSGNTGVMIFPANGAFTPLSTLSVPGIGRTPVVFTPDGALAFSVSCITGGPESIISFSRHSDGTLTQSSMFTLPGTCQGGCPLPCLPGRLRNLTVSADGRFLATTEVQIYSISSNGSLTPVLPQPFTVVYSDGLPVGTTDLVWDTTGSYLAVATYGAGVPPVGGIGVLNFSGSALTQTMPPNGGPLYRLTRTGSFIYGMGCTYANVNCGYATPLSGYLFQNGQLTPLPGSPYAGTYPDLVIY